jgi:hypothetical protein
MRGVEGEGDSTLLRVTSEVPASRVSIVRMMRSIKRVRRVSRVDRVGRVSRARELVELGRQAGSEGLLS